MDREHRRGVGVVICVKINDNNKIIDFGVIESLSCAVDNVLASISIKVHV